MTFTITVKYVDEPKLYTFPGRTVDMMVDVVENVDLDTREAMKLDGDTNAY